MPRIARIVIPDLAHHITQRGNNRQDVFFVDDDRRAYLNILGEQSRKHGLAILGYCLMTNHVHLIVVPRRVESLARALGRTHCLYTQHINRLHKRSGHLWQNRFYSAAMDDQHALLAMRYIECNPLRARMCRVATRHRWSSAAAHCGIEDSAGVLDLARWQQMRRKLNWEAALTETLPEPQVRAIRRSTHTGRPLASDSMLSKLEKRLGKRLRASPVGRPGASMAKTA